MRRIFILALLALGMTGGVAAADSYRNHGGYHRGHSSWNNSRGGVSVQRSYPRQTYRSTYRSSWRPSVRVHVQPRVQVVRRPIYVQRPVIRYRYYNYYQRPALLVENYAAQPGYYWVAGQWQWNGYEWLWQPGHYEPDPSYIEPGYGDGYSNGYSYDGY